MPLFNPMIVVCCFAQVNHDGVRHSEKRSWLSDPHPLQGQFCLPVLYMDYSIPFRHFGLLQPYKLWGHRFCRRHSHLPQPIVVGLS